MEERAEAAPVCPACHAAESGVRYTVGVAEAAQHYVRAEADPARHEALRARIETLWGGTTCALRECARCGFGFAWPYVAGDEAFYTLAYERTGYPAWKWEHERTRAALRGLGLDAPHVLEVGAGDGAFVRGIAPALTPPAHVVTTEFSAYGREALAQSGVESLPLDVRDLPLDAYGGRFDAICLFQVLEHLDRLDALFAHLGALTRPAGHLFIGVPNGARIAFNEAHGGLRDLPPNHIGRWTPEAFGAIAARHGWRARAHEVEPEGGRLKASRFGTHRFMRARQTPGTLAHAAERLPGPVRRVAQPALAAGYLAAAAGPLARLVRDPALGAHQWVHLERGGA